MHTMLNHKLAAIGVRLAGIPAESPAPDLEATLLDASSTACHDGRLESIEFSWIHVHAAHVLVEKLQKQLRHADPVTRLMWSALAACAVKQGQHKWRKVIEVPTRPVQLFPGNVEASALSLKGPEPWLAEYHILVPAGRLRIRESDILTIEELARMNRQYRNRLLYGASWRADIITAIEEGAATASAIVRQTGCSYEPAHRIRKEYLIATQAGLMTAAVP